MVSKKGKEEKKQKKLVCASPNNTKAPSQKTENKEYEEQCKYNKGTSHGNTSLWLASQMILPASFDVLTRNA